ncbi:MAG: hypothetical protein MHPSP_004276, partial [Paramarteilia canceri]
LFINPMKLLPLDRFMQNTPSGATRKPTKGGQDNNRKNFGQNRNGGKRQSFQGRKSFNNNNNRGGPKQHFQKKRF